MRLSFLFVLLFLPELIYPYKAMIYKETLFKGRRQYVSGNSCRNVTIVVSNGYRGVESVNTYDTCVVLYEKRNCLGYYHYVAIGTPAHYDMKRIGAYQSKSIGPCPVDVKLPPDYKSQTMDSSLQSTDPSSSSDEDSSLEVIEGKIDDHSSLEDTHYSMKSLPATADFVTTQAIFENTIEQKREEIEGLLPLSKEYERSNLLITVGKQQQALTSMNEEISRLKEMEGKLISENEILKFKNRSFEAIFESLEQTEKKATNQRQKAFAQFKLCTAARVHPMEGIGSKMKRRWFTISIILTAILAAGLCAHINSVNYAHVNPIADAQFGFRGIMVKDLLPELTEHENELLVEAAKHGQYRTVDEFFTALAKKSPTLHKNAQRRGNNFLKRLFSLEDEAHSAAAMIYDAALKMQNANFASNNFTRNDIDAQVYECALLHKNLPVHAKRAFDKQFPVTATILENLIAEGGHVKR